MARRYRWQPLKGLVPCKVGRHQCHRHREPAFGRGLADDVQPPFAGPLDEVGHPLAPAASRTLSAVQEPDQPAAALVALPIALVNHRGRCKYRFGVFGKSSIAGSDRPYGVPEKAHHNEDFQSPNTQLTVYANFANVKAETACRRMGYTKHGLARNFLWRSWFRARGN